VLKCGKRGETWPEFESMYYALHGVDVDENDDDDDDQ